MKRFIISVVAFALIIVIVIGGVCAAEIIAEINKYHEEVVAPEGTSVLICNDSQTGNGVDSELYPMFFNFSAHGRTLDQAYLTVRDVLEYSPKGRIKTVVFDVTPAAAVWPLHDPLPKMVFPAKYWLLHCMHLKENIRPLNGVLKVARDNLVGRRLRHFSRAIRGKVEFHSSLYGLHTPMDDRDKDCNPDRYWGLLNAKVASCKGLASLSLDSPFLTEVLDKVVACTKKNGVRLLIITTPWSEDLRNAFTAAELDSFTDTMIRYAADRKVEYVDFLQMPIDPNGWGDGNHLNRVGGKLFTTRLVKELEKRGML